MGQRGPRDRLGDRGQVVGQPHEQQRVDHGRVGGEVAEPGAGERERLGHRAGDDQPGPARQQGERARRAGPAELGVGLVDDDHAGRGVAERLDRGRAASAVPVGLFGEVRKTTSAACSAIASRAPSEVEPKSVGAGRRRSSRCRCCGRSGCIE